MDALFSVKMYDVINIIKRNKKTLFTGRYSEWMYESTTLMLLLLATLTASDAELCAALGRPLAPQLPMSHAEIVTSRERSMRTQYESTEDRFSDWRTTPVLLETLTRPT